MDIEKLKKAKDLEFDIEKEKKRLAKISENGFFSEVIVVNSSYQSKEGHVSFTLEEIGLTQEKLIEYSKSTLDRLEFEFKQL